MSGSATFQLLAGEGKLDRIVFGNHVLYSRLVDIITYKKSAPTKFKGDILPSYADIEQSHLFFLNGIFRPIVQIAFEYFVYQTSGMVVWGREAQFEVQQAGEFWLDMMVHLTSDPVVTADIAKVSGDHNDPMFKYCDYPGERALDLCKFTINSGPIDEYTSNSYVFFRQFFLKADRRAGWDRCMGQEAPSRGWTDQPANYDAATSITEDYRFAMPTLEGNQTYKRDNSVKNTGLELCIPLIFYFNSDPRSAFPSVCVPTNNRRLVVKLTNWSNMAYVRPAGAALAPTMAAPNVQVELYVNYLYIPDYLHVIILRRVQFNLVRLHLEHTEQINKTSFSSPLQNGFKYPVEFFVSGVIPTENFTDPENSMTDWHRFCDVEHRSGAMHKGYSDDIAAQFTALASPLVGLAEPTNVWLDESPTLTSLSMKAMAVVLYPVYPINFYNSYIPTAFASKDLCTPDDPGLALILFCMYAGSYNPNGHLNTSRTREMQLIGTCPTINSSRTGELRAVAQVINFAIVAEGTYTIRYQT